MARYQKGQSGNPSGRKPGSKNKFTQLKTREVWEILNERNCNPFEILADLAIDETVSDRTRMEAAGILCEYVEPKLKSVELSNKDGEGFTMIMDGISFNPAPALPAISNNEVKNAD